jgi:GcrA cell cycle regulator
MRGTGDFFVKIPGGKMSWTEARIAALKQDWADGYTCSQIANRLSRSGDDLTRNAVIGKARRLGLPARIQTRRHSTRRSERPPAAWFVNRREANSRGQAGRTRNKIDREFAPLPQLRLNPRILHSQPPPDMAEPFIPLDQRKGVLELGNNDCRWPIGDPQNADFHFCGHAKHPDFVYCELHARKAYAPPQAMRERAYFPTGTLHRKLKAA